MPPCARFRVIDAPHQYIRHKLDIDENGNTTTTTSTTTVQSEAPPNDNVYAPPYQQRRLRRRNTPARTRPSIRRRLRRRLRRGASSRPKVASARARTDLDPFAEGDDTFTTTSSHVRPTNQTAPYAAPADGKIEPALRETGPGKTRICFQPFDQTAVTSTSLASRPGAK